MQTKENNSSLSTKYIKSDGIRKLVDLTNYETIRQQQKMQMKYTISHQYQKILGRLPDAKFFNPKSESYVSYPCYNEKYLQFPKEILSKLKKRTQDDDCDTDEEVKQHSINHNVTEILKSLSAINKKSYETSEYL
ncbi:unnamed protein product [Paramecium sonneborni]|uniref:Uncharacterized protein n=1 Tax=Paramecium sonneborni TaxID=65129 RepID=A0A8S1RAT1_9CILI|nr:unnamed protein product [Paramecium sonneborni]